MNGDEKGFLHAFRGLFGFAILCCNVEPKWGKDPDTGEFRRYCEILSKALKRMAAALKKL